MFIVALREWIGYSSSDKNEIYPVEFNVLEDYKWLLFIIKSMQNHQFLNISNFFNANSFAFALERLACFKPQF